MKCEAGRQFYNEQDIGFCVQSILRFLILEFKVMKVATFVVKITQLMGSKLCPFSSDAQLGFPGIFLFALGLLSFIVFILHHIANSMLRLQN